MKLSICIPTFNGSKTLEQTLESIISQMESGIEVVLCDDKSTDQTQILISKYASKYPFVRSVLNTNNLGMDGNFRRSALSAHGEYVWFSGQDDIFEPGILRKVLEVLNSKNNLSFVYLNYAQYNFDFSQVICPSVLRDHWISNSSFSEGEDLYIQTHEQYFSLFNAAPTFLPATIIKKIFWDDTDVSKFIGTNYVQTALILLNMKGSSWFVVAGPSIKGRIPEDGWQSEGRAYFNVMSGYVLMESLVFRDLNNPVPSWIFEASRNKFFKNFFPLIRRSKTSGMRPRIADIIRLKSIFWNQRLRLSVSLCILLTPKIALETIYHLGSKTKKVANFFRYFFNLSGGHQRKKW